MKDFNLFLLESNSLYVEELEDYFVELMDEKYTVTIESRNITDKSATYRVSIYGYMNDDKFMGKIINIGNRLSKKYKIEEVKANSDLRTEDGPIKFVNDSHFIITANNKIIVSKTYQNILDILRKNKIEEKSITRTDKSISVEKKFYRNSRAKFLKIKEDLEKAGLNPKKEIYTYDLYYKGKGFDMHMTLSSYSRYGKFSLYYTED